MGKPSGLPFVSPTRNIAFVTTGSGSVQGRPEAALDGEPRTSEDRRHPESADQPRLTVAAVARRLGVAPATLRTWDRRYGLGPSDHTSGRHRRYDPEDVARLEQMQRALLRGASPAEAARYARSVTAPLAQPPVPAVDRAAGKPPEDGVLLSGVLGSPPEESEVRNTGGRGLRLTGAGPRARGLGRAVLALDSWSAQHLLIEAVEAEGVVETWRDVLQPVLQAIVERRQRSGTGTEVLQLLLDCASTALRSVIANAPAPLNPRPVLLASVPGESQELELVSVAAALATRQVGHRLFGAALPKEGLDAAVRRAAPAAVVLWASHTHNAAPHLISDLPGTRQRFRAFAAGPGWVADALPAHVERVPAVADAVERVVATVLR